jgi:hypothetical protein
MSQRFTVVWSPELEANYAARRNSASSLDRQRLTEAANRIDHDLRFAPNRRGRGSPERPDRHVWRVHGIEPPVVVVFDVSAEDRIIRVLEIFLNPERFE